MNPVGSRIALAALAALAALTLTGCFSPPITGSPVSDSPAPSVSHNDDATTPDDSNTAEPTAPAQQAASCEWDLARISADATQPTGQAGDLATAMIGSWQHTHFDTGSGMEPNTNDIRYVFSSPGELIYCQHVEGVTDHAENRAAISLDGNIIQPPSPHPGFAVTAWSADRMLWTNNFDGSTYLLVRR